MILPNCKGGNGQLFYLPGEKLIWMNITYHQSPSVPVHMFQITYTILFIAFLLRQLNLSGKEEGSSLKCLTMSPFDQATVPRYLVKHYSRGFSVQFSSVAQSCLTLSDPMDCSTLGFPVCITNSRNLLKLMSIELVMPSNHLILCRPLLLLPSIFPSIRVFSNE